MDRTFKFFDGGSDIVVIGQNPEMADVDNPRGDIYGFQSWVRISNEYGDTKVLYLGTHRTEWAANASAYQMAQVLQVRLDNLGKLPVNFGSWAPSRPRYGSQAYIDYGADEDIAWEKAQG